MVSVAAGVVLVLSIFLLQLRLGVDRRLAWIVAALFGISPVTALYENWLYPSYLVAAALAVGTLVLHRYLSYGYRRDGAAFFLLLGGIVLTRGTYHPVWFLVPAVALLLAMPSLRRRTLAAMAVPLAAVVGVAVLTWVNFGTLVTGHVYQDVNLAQMTTMRLSDSTVEMLIRQGKISPINRLDVYEAEPVDYLPYVPPPPRTGVAVLDQPLKATGAVNWHSAWFVLIADQYGKDARVVRREYPGVYASSVRDNLERFFIPPDQSYPFVNVRGDDPMRVVLRAWDLVLGGQLRHKGVAPFTIAAVLGSILFGLLVVHQWRVRRKPGPTKADALTVLFMVYTFLYVAVVTIVFSSNDHSRYRFETMPLVVVLLAMTVSAAWRRYGRPSTQTPDEMNGARTHTALPRS